MRENGEKHRFAFHGFVELDRKLAKSVVSTKIGPGFSGNQFVWENLLFTINFIFS